MRMKGRPRVSRIHSDTISGAASAATRSIQGKPNQMAASRSGPRTAADRIRRSRPRCRSSRPTGASAADAAITPLAPAELGDRLFQVLLAEIRPQRVDEHQLGVGTLPQHEIADALLAAGADQQVGVGHARGQQLAFKAILVDAIGRQLAGRDLPGEAADGLQDLGARAIVDADIHVDAAVAARHVLGVENVANDVGREPLAIADDAEPRAVFAQLVELVAQIVAQQAHQVVHFVGRPSPVFGREGKQRQHRYAELASAAHDPPHRVGAAPVAGDPRQAARRRPPSIAIHVDGNVVGTRCRIRIGGQRRSRHQTVLISFSLLASTSSTCLTKRSVSFCTSSDFWRCSSCEILWSFSAFFSASMPSRRTLRTATRPSSAYLWASLASSARRSVVSSGIGMRIICPSGAGLRPRPASRIALAVATTKPLSQTLTVSRRGSGALTVPTWLSAMRWP